MLLRQLRSLIGSHRRGARFSQRAKHGSRGRLFEQLESRCVLSCTAVVDPLKSSLVVTGDGGANKVAIRNDDLQGIVVTCDGSVFKADQAKHIGINTLGGPDTFEVTLGDIKIDPNNPNTPLDLNLNGGGGADAFLIGLLSVAIEGDLDLTAEGGDGNDTFDLKVEDVQLTGQTGPETSPHVRLHGGNGADAFLIGLLNVVAPSGPAALHLDVTSGGGNDDVTAHVEDNFIDLHLDVDLGAGQDTFTATILPDSGVNLASGDFLALGCIEANVLGGAGADRFQVNVGQPNAPEPGKPQPLLASELMLSLDGGSEADEIGVTMHNVALGAEAQIGVDSGIGADRILIGLLNVAVPSDPSSPEVVAAGSDDFLGEQVAINFDLFTGAGDDRVMTSVEGLGICLNFDARLGAGRDLFNAKLAMGGADPCVIFGISGGDGADVFDVDVFGAQTPGTSDKLPDPDDGLQLNFDGGGGADAFLIGLLNVAISGPVTLIGNGGDGNDVFMTRFAGLNGDGVWKTDFDGGDGNDLFMTKFADVNGDGVWKTDFKGGNGNDTLMSSISNFSPEYFLTADLGGGNDLAVMSIVGPDVGPIGNDDGAPSSLGIDIAGGDGRDSLFLNFRGGLLGPTSVVLDGGEGNDAIDAVFNLASTNDYSLLAHVVGGKGNDNLALHVKVFDAGQSELDLLLDASQGRDKYRVSDNVTVQKV